MKLNKTLIGMALFLGLMSNTFADPSSVAPSLLEGISIIESGQAPVKMKKNLGVGFRGGRSANTILKQHLNGEVTFGGWLPQEIGISGFSRVYAEQSGSFDTGSYMIRDIEPNRILMLNVPATEELLYFAKADPLNADIGVISQGARLASALGSESSTIAGVAIGLIANLASHAFATRGADNSPMNKGNPSVTAANCGAACAITHHEVTLLLVYGSSAKERYGVTVRKTADKIDPTILAPIANIALGLIAEKIKQAALTKTQPTSEPEQ